MNKRSKEVQKAIVELNDIADRMKDEGYHFNIGDGTDADKCSANIKEVTRYIIVLENKVERFNKELDLDYVDNNFISKDKIRDKIKELEEEKKKYFGMQGLQYSELALQTVKIQVLRELLEGE